MSALQVKSLRVFVEGSDIIEHWIFDKKINSRSGELDQNMKEYFSENILPKADENPLASALLSASENIPAEYAFFGDLVEIRYNDALKQFEAE